MILLTKFILCFACLIETIKIAYINNDLYKCRLIIQNVVNPLNEENKFCIVTNANEGTIYILYDNGVDIEIAEVKKDPNCGYFSLPSVYKGEIFLESKEGIREGEFLDGHCNDFITDTSGIKLPRYNQEKNKWGLNPYLSTTMISLPVERSSEIPNRMGMYYFGVENDLFRIQRTPNNRNALGILINLNECSLEVDIGNNVKIDHSIQVCLFASESHYSLIYADTFLQKGLYRDFSIGNDSKCLKLNNVVVNNYLIKGIFDSESIQPVSDQKCDFRINNDFKNVTFENGVLFKPTDYDLISVYHIDYVERPGEFPEEINLRIIDQDNDQRQCTPEEDTTFIKHMINSEDSETPGSSGRGIILLGAGVALGGILILGAVLYMTAGDDYLEYDLDYYDDPIEEYEPAFEQGSLTPLDSFI